MQYRALALLLLVLFPAISYAQSSIQQYIVDIGDFINTTIIPFLIAIAFFFFAFNAIRYFVIGGDNETSRENARQLAVYGIAAFVVIASIWGIVGLLLNATGFARNTPLINDYQEEFCLRNDCRSGARLNPIGSAGFPTYSNDSGSGGAGVDIDEDGSEFDQVDWATAARAVAATSLLTSCQTHVSYEIEQLLTDPTLSRNEQLAYAKALAETNPKVISDSSFTNLLEVYNRESNAGLLPSGVNGSLASPEKIDAFKGMRQMQVLVKNSIDTYFSGSTVATTAYCELFNPFNSSRPSSIPVELWDDEGVKDQFDVYRVQMNKL